MKMTCFEIDILAWRNQFSLFILKFLIFLIQLVDLLLIKGNLFTFLEYIFLHRFLVCFCLNQTLAIGNLIQLALINGFLFSMNLVYVLLLLQCLCKLNDIPFHFVIFSFSLSYLQVIVNYLVSLTFVWVSSA